MNPHLVVLSTLLLLTVATRAEEPVGASADTEGESGVHALSASASVPETAFTNPGSDIPPGLGLDVEPEAAPGALPIERLTWHKLPLQITLPVGQERLVSFPVAVRAGLPPTLTPDVLRTQILNDGTIYWTALKPFGPQRVRIGALGTGNTYLLDLSASDRIADTRPIEVSIPEGKPSAAPVDAAATDVAENRSAGTDYVTLTRMAAQHLYAPERLLKVPKGVHRTPVGRESRIDLIRGGRVEATPLIAWRSGGTYITAVKLRNRTFEDVILDPRTLRGAWLACTFQHARLYRKGDERDVTAAYLVSSRPFEDALDGRQ